MYQAGIRAATKGFSFELADLRMARSWAAANGLLMEIRLDHAVDASDCEEAVVLHQRDGSFRALIWREAQREPEPEDPGLSASASEAVPEPRLAGAG